MAVPPVVARSIRRLALGSLAVLLAAGAAGLAIEWWRLGAGDAAARARIERGVTSRFAELTARLDAAVARVGVDAGAIRAAELGTLAATRRLFDRVAAAVDARSSAQVSLIVLGAAQQPLAWAGTGATPLGVHLATAPSLFMSTGAHGARLVRVHPMAAEPSGAASAGGAVVAELPLQSAFPSARVRAPDAVEIEVASVRVAVRPYDERTGGAAAGFAVRGPGGAPVAWVDVSGDAIAEGRERFRGQRDAVLLALVALALLAGVGPLVDWRRLTRRAAVAAGLTAAAALLLLVARGLLWIAVRRADLATPALTTMGTWSAMPALMLASPADFALSSLMAAGLVGLLASGASLWRVARRPGLGAMPVASVGAGALFLATHLTSGGVVLALLAGHAWFLRAHVSQAPADILRFSLAPWDATRLPVVVGLVALNAAVAGAAIQLFRLAGMPWIYARRRRAWQAAAVAAWLLPATLLALPWARERVPVVPIAAAIAACGAAAWAAERYRAALRHGSEAMRLLAAFLALAAPSVVLYPALVDAAQRARRLHVESRYAPEVLNLRADVQQRLNDALWDIDRMQDELIDLLGAHAPAAGAMPSVDAAFRVWSRTALATERLTSSVELHDGAGVVLSRFALRLHDSRQACVEGGSRQACVEASCEWEVFGDVLPFFAEERRIVRAGRAICERDTKRPLGSIVVNVMPDYGSLSFVSAQNPYEALLRSGRPSLEPRLQVGVELTTYGWSRRVLYASSQMPPALPDAAFERALASRAPFWTTVVRGQTIHDAHVRSDRGGLYVLALPRPSLADHLATIGEMVSLAFVLFVLLAAGGVAVNAATGRRGVTGRELLREVRGSFYRKLFLAFVAATVVPVLALALVSRAYLRGLVFADIESEASRTAEVASRIVEDYVSRPPGGVAGTAAVDDNLAVWLSRATGQDVNIFDGAQLRASSERNLFVAGLLPMRTPGDAYRAVVIEGRPSYVGRDAVGDLEYVVAAAPVRVLDRPAVLTVPQASRQAQSDALVQELDRRVLLAALLIIVAGAGIGFSMAERIADPVSRLMRATERIARGDLDQRVLASSSDELRRLVEAFNQMAVDLQRQRRELERTNRLQAWADMARQVAHDIKNPLTPIQLSAEHLRRVHADRGRPLGGVVDDCVTSILGQVRLLRRIATEFSSFASSPAPRVGPVRLADLVAEVVDPYRAGLSERVSVVTDVPAGLPVARIDRVLMGRALTNVVENALHAMPDGGTLSIDAKAADGAVTLRVADTGAGMDAEALGRVFEPYFSTKTTGTGLGLTIAKRNTEASGGTIAVESAPGRGTVVTMRLPVA